MTDFLSINGLYRELYALWIVQKIYKVEVLLPKPMHNYIQVTFSLLNMIANHKERLYYMYIMN